MSSATEQSTGDEGIERDVGHERIEREIGHDEFDPIGTLVLIGIYFAILVGLWVLIYFVEFLGRGPTVV
ncbi:MAG: hypothetical protein V5A55_11850 [Halovenus sp.]